MMEKIVCWDALPFNDDAAKYPNLSEPCKHCRLSNVEARYVAFPKEFVVYGCKRCGFFQGDNAPYFMRALPSAEALKVDLAIQKQCIARLQADLQDTRRELAQARFDRDDANEKVMKLEAILATTRKELQEAKDKFIQEHVTPRMRTMHVPTGVGFFMGFATAVMITMVAALVIFSSCALIGEFASRLSERVIFSIASAGMIGVLVGACVAFESETIEMEFVPLGERLRCTMVGRLITARRRVTLAERRAKDAERRINEIERAFDLTLGRHVFSEMKRMDDGRKG